MLIKVTFLINLIKYFINFTAFFAKNKKAYLKIVRIYEFLKVNIIILKTQVYFKII